MTAVERNDSDLTERPFRQWLREHPGLDSIRERLSMTNRDLLVHRFSERNERRRVQLRQVIDQLMQVEVKSFSADVPFAQSDTLGIFDDLLRLATVKNDRRQTLRIRDRRRPGCMRIVRYLGLHFLQMSADRPDTSDRIIWDGKHIIVEDVLVEILRFDRDPDHPSKRLDTRRHHRQSAREAHPQLQLIG